MRQDILFILLTKLEYDIISIQQKNIRIDNRYVSGVRTISRLFSFSMKTITKLKLCLVRKRKIKRMNKVIHIYNMSENTVFMELSEAFCYSVDNIFVCTANG